MVTLKDNIIELYTLGISINFVLILLILIFIILIYKKPLLNDEIKIISIGMFIIVILSFIGTMVFLILLSLISLTYMSKRKKV